MKPRWKTVEKWVKDEKQKENFQRKWRKKGQQIPENDSIDSNRTYTERNLTR